MKALVYEGPRKVTVKEMPDAKIEKPTEVDRVHARVAEIIGDPLPYGLGANRHTLEQLIGHARTQGIIEKPVRAEELFAPETLGLIS